MQFETSRAFEHIDRLSYEIGPRVSGTRGERLSADYIERCLRSTGIEVRRQSFTFTDKRARERTFAVLLTATFLVSPLFSLLVSAPVWLSFLALSLFAPFPRRRGLNLIARIPGGRPPLALSAHHDTAGPAERDRASHTVILSAATAVILIRPLVYPWVALWAPIATLLVASTINIFRDGRPSPGANDNASGVAVLLEVARCLAGEQNRPELHLLFTGGEEFSQTGMRYLVRSGILPKGVPILNVDTVGYGGQAYYVEGNGLNGSVRTSEEMNRRLAEAAARLSIEIRPWWSARSNQDHVEAILAGHPSTTLTFESPKAPTDREAVEAGLKNARRSTYRWLHTPEDLPDKLDPATVETAGNMILELLLGEFKQGVKEDLEVRG
jgi:hypothetical protein